MGEFVDDHPKDTQGVMEWTDGTYFVGEIIWGVIQGKGRKTYPNGDVYDGNFFQDERSSDGKMYFSDGRIGTGKWKQDKLQGPYTEIMPKQWKKECVYKMGKETKCHEFIWNANKEDWELNEK